MSSHPKIDPEIASLLPPLTADEKRTLITNLQNDGCRDALVVWDEEDILLDGHNRMEICDQEGIKYRIERVSLASRHLAIQWVIDKQLGQRNLTDERRAYFIGKEYLATKQAHGGDRKSIRQNDGLIGEAAKAVAEKHGVSTRTVERDAEFAEAVDQKAPEQREEILSGKSGKTKAAVIREAVLCERCQRVGSRPDCPQCAKEREAKAKKKKPKKKPKEREKLTDRIGTVVPDHCRDIFADTSLAELVSDITSVEAMCSPDTWLKRATKLTDHYGFILIDKFKEHIYEAVERLQLAAEALRAGLPHAVCPKCEAAKQDGKVCKGCRGYGYVPEHRYAELTK